MPEKIRLWHDFLETVEFDRVSKLIKNIEIFA